MAETTAPRGLDMSTVLASSIHDMKNSLSLVLQTVEALADDAEAPAGARRERYRRLHHEALRLNNQMLQMLTLYRLQQQICTVDSEECPVADLLEECALEHAPVLAGRGIRIDWDCDPELLGFFDHDLVAGVLGNALNNAQRFARSAVRLGGETYAYAAGHGVCLSVEDDGPGFSAHKLSALRHGQCQPGTEPGDTGLGLLFSARVAAQHRNRGESGRIACDNGGALGGAQFLLYLP